MRDRAGIDGPMDDIGIVSSTPIIRLSVQLIGAMCEGQYTEMQVSLVYIWHVYVMFQNILMNMKWWEDAPYYYGIRQEQTIVIILELSAITRQQADFTQLPGDDDQTPSLCAIRRASHGYDEIN